MRSNFFYADVLFLCADVLLVCVYVCVYVCCVLCLLSVCS